MFLTGTPSVSSGAEPRGRRRCAPIPARRVSLTHDPRGPPYGQRTDRPPVDRVPRRRTPERRLQPVPHAHRRRPRHWLTEAMQNAHTLGLGRSFRTTVTRAAHQRDIPVPRLRQGQQQLTELDIRLVRLVTDGPDTTVPAHGTRSRRDSPRPGSTEASAGRASRRSARPTTDLADINSGSRADSPSTPAAPRPGRRASVPPASSGPWRRARHTVPPASVVLEGDNRHKRTAVRLPGIST